MFPRRVFGGRSAAVADPLYPPTPPPPPPPSHLLHFRHERNQFRGPGGHGLGLTGLDWAAGWRERERKKREKRILRRQAGCGSLESHPASLTPPIRQPTPCPTVDCTRGGRRCMLSRNCCGGRLYDFFCILMIVIILQLNTDASHAQM